MQMKSLSLLLAGFLLSFAVFGVANGKEVLQPVYFLLLSDNPSLSVTHALTITIAGTGTGTTTGAGIYAEGVTQAISATATTGSTFIGWSGDADCTDGFVTMNVDKNCIATFNLTPAPTPGLVFVTSTTYTGNLGGTIGADAKCMIEADAAGLPGTYKAWISTSQSSPNAQFIKNIAGYTLVDGTVVATSWDDLVAVDDLSPFPHSINMTAVAGVYVSSNYVWTGTNTSGEAYDGAETVSRCNNWSSSSESNTGLVGHTDYSGVGWTQITSIICSLSSSLYCFQQ